MQPLAIFGANIRFLVISCKEILIAAHVSAQLQWGQSHGVKFLKVEPLLQMVTLFLSQVGFLSTQSLLCGNHSWKNTSNVINWVSYGRLTALDLQSIQDILSLSYHQVLSSADLCFGIVRLWRTSIIYFIIQKTWPHLDFPSVSVSFSGDKAAHCWDTCAITSVSGAPCLLTPAVLSTPLPLCLFQRVAWGGRAALADGEGTACWETWPWNDHAKPCSTYASSLSQGGPKLWCSAEHMCSFYFANCHFYNFSLRCSTQTKQ